MITPQGLEKLGYWIVVKCESVVIGQIDGEPVDVIGSEQSPMYSFIEGETI